MDKVLALSMSIKAQRQVDKLYLDLKHDYSKEYADKFIKDFHLSTSLIRSNPMLFEATESSKRIRKGFVNKYVSYFYRINKKSIRVLSLKFNRSGKPSLY